MDILGMLAKAAGLIPLVMILVSAIKKLEIKGRALTVLSFVVGVLLGVLSEWAVAPFVTFQNWFIGIVYGLVIGAGACGAYDLGDRWFKPKPAPIVPCPDDEMAANPYMRELQP